MATEPTAVDSPADVPESLTIDSSANDSQNAVPDTPVLNGGIAADDVENKRTTNVEDQVNSAEPSVSEGSDTEASRADGSKSKDGDKSQLRAGTAVKKPTTFKAVSVNRKFLATKTGTTSPSPILGDKGPGSKTPPPGSGTLLASRPRLVAKTGSGARDSLPRFTNAANGAKPASTPDPNVVWNRNKPPEPKKFTDEELKKYGIHMASRLDEDEAQGQNKWADIDDDDDDWAPEAVTWADGTKMTLPPPDEQAPIPTADAIAAPEAKVEEDKAETAAAPAPLDAPVAKPGGFASGRGLVLKSGPQEKPNFSAKPPAPQQAARSPWATLPPVARASPGAEPAPVQRAPPAHYRDMQQPPPREFAADDFSRSGWRDGSSQGNRELFNSQSGLYEPVSERRGSMRHDSQSRHPALLQRPSGGDHPAEPSSAFQTNRTAQDHSFGRRRASSNLSGGSGAYFPRMGKGGDGQIPPADQLNLRRPSLAGSVESPVAAHVQPVPAQQGQHRGPPSGGWPTRSPGTAHAALQQQPGVLAAPQQQPGVPAAPAPLGEDDVELQKKIMRDSREQARKRREEEEARLEAEKRERIRKKLEALGPAPEKKEAPQRPNIQIQQREHKDASQSIAEAISQIQRAEADKEANQESSTGKPRRLSMNNAGPAPPQARRMSQDQEGKRPDIWNGPGARPERYAAWPHGTQPPLRSVWGSPDNDRGLGNGTFNPDLGLIPDAGGSRTQTGKGPAPIAPPSVARPAAESRPPPPAPIGSRPSRYNAPGSDMANKWVSAVVDNDKKLSAERLAERVEREAQLAERGLTIEDAQPQIKDTWRPVHTHGDGTRRAVGPIGGAPPPPPPNPAGVIGSKSGSVLAQGSQGSSSQGRPSRFFPTRDQRADSHDTPSPGRPLSPSPPPPTMEDHPAYEGDVMHPHVSLPKAKPVVKLPPLANAANAVQATQPLVPLGWASHTPFRDPSRVPAYAPPPPPPGARGSGSSQEKWQSKFDTLFHSEKSSPPKAMVVDPASRNALDHAALHQDSATVSLPGKAANVSLSGNQRSPNTKPMAEECFEEQEMGSLPQIRLPHEIPTAAWQPALKNTKPLPRKFLIQASIVEPYYFSSEVVNGGNAVRIRFPGMTDAKTTTIPFTSIRGGRGGAHGRPGPRRGSSHVGRGGKREPSSSHGDREPHSDSRGRGRGGYRGRGSESWSRQPSSSQPSIST